MSIFGKSVNCNVEENLLLIGCDVGNLNQVKDILQAYRTKSITLSPLILSKSFKYVIIQHHLDLIQLFLLPNPIISQDDIDEAFTRQVHLGLYPEIIYLLQDYCSTRLLAELNRYQRKARFNCYLIQPSEMEQILLYQRLLLKKVKKVSVLTPSSSKSTYLYLQLQMNNLFFDGGFCNWRYLIILMMQRVPFDHFPVVNNILSSSSASPTSHNEKLIFQPDFIPEHNILPSQTTINHTFSIVLKKGNFPLADIMCSPNPLNSQLVVNQEGIDDAIRLAVIESNCPAIEWFYTNEGGVRPSQDVTDKVYRDLVLYEQRLSRPDELNRFNMYRHFYASQRRKQSVESSEKREEVRQLIDVVSMYVPQEVIAELQEQVRRNDERERRMIQARHRMAMHQHGSDIHSYSAAMIGEGEGAMVIDEENPFDEGDFEGNEEAMDIVEDHVPPIPIVPAEAPNPIPNDRPQAAPFPHLNQINQINQINQRPAANPNSVHQRRTLNSAIYEHLKERVGADFSFHQDLVTTELTNLVQQYLPADKQDEAYRRLGEMLNRESVENFGVTLAFLRMYHPSQMGVWITGFLGESIDVHSCTPGAMERIATGLRGIGDEGLDRIFSQAEGPQLFRIFLSTFNIFDARQGTKYRDKLVDILLESHIHPMSSLEEVKEALNEYLLRMKEQFGISSTSMKGDLESLVEVILDVYETDVLPPLREKFLAKQQDQQQPQPSHQMEEGKSTNV